MAKVSVEAAHHPTGKGMFRDALGSLKGPSPSLLWVDFPCDGNTFDQGGRGGGGEGGAALEASSSWGAGKGAGADDRHWNSLPQVDRRYDAHCCIIIGFALRQRAVHTNVFRSDSNRTLPTTAAVVRVSFLSI